ncbi:MAG: MTH938/NDUFAF3 family protein [Gammaproteobacteria bacterium]|nr:MTH938/NDUFAF3 family protein [Gammaproteobacteria bacterium]
MQISLDYNMEAYTIRSYGPGEILVIPPISTREIQEERQTLFRERELPSVRLHKTAVITPSSLQENWAPGSVAEMTREHFAELAALRPEVVILGAGSRSVFPHPSLTVPLSSAGIGLEVMSTASACRTYNYLMTDNRPVVAVLFPIIE